MDTTSIIVLLVVGAVIGWLAGVIMRGFGFGLIGNIIVGVIGSFVGTWLFTRILGIQIGISPIVDLAIYSLVGAVILLFIVGLLRRSK